MASRHTHDTSEGRRQASAGRAIAVTVIGLLLGTLFNADSLVASIEGQSFGSSRSTELSLARPVRTVSHWTGLNLPRKLVDDIANDSPGGGGAALPRPLPTTTTSTSAVAANPPGTTAPTTTTLPSRRVPTAQQPLKVWLAGDSLMGTIAESFAARESSDPLVRVTSDFRIGTGLARPDVYNWPNAISQEMASVDPDVVVLLFGANDDQDMEAGGHRFNLQSDDWKAEYARRVDQVLAATTNGVRQVIWLGIPAVRRPRLNKTKDLINAVLASTTAQHTGAAYVDTGSMVDGSDGSFTTYLSNPSGKSVAVRESDGIHMTLAGADRVTPKLIGDVDAYWAMPS